jgi:predicted metal-binding membrane protein
VTAFAAGPGGRSSAGTPAPLTWWRREHLAPAFVLLTITALSWAYTLQGGSMGGMPMPHAPGMGGSDIAAGMSGMGMAPGAGSAGAAPASGGPAGLILFLAGWAVMMVAMMLPAALPLVLVYRAMARRRMLPRRAAAGVGALLAGYLVVWTIAGLPVYGYGEFFGSAGPAVTVLPGILLVVGGIYQFTAVKQVCHTRCSSPLFFLMHRWRPGVRGAARLGVLHGIDCLGCCAGLMLALVALGMMNAAWMLTAAVIVFVEKTVPGGHRVARPLGVALVVGGLVLVGAPLLGSRTGV